MVVSIHQPDYIPYLGYFYKIACSDVFVFLDDAQFSSDNMHHWNVIKTPQGECRLKIPVEHRFGDSINRVRTKDELKWKDKHLRTLEMNYARAPYYRDVFPKFKELLLSSYNNLAQMNMEINRFFCDSFGLHPRYYVSSEMDIHTVREERVIDLCCAVGGTTYLSGHGASVYQVDEHFKERGLGLRYTDYTSNFTYSQLWRDFLPNMSALDYVLNCGFDWDAVERAVRGGR